MDVGRVTGEVAEPVPPESWWKRSVEMDLCGRGSGYGRGLRDPGDSGGKGRWKWICVDVGRTTGEVVGTPGAIGGNDRRKWICVDVGWVTGEWWERPTEDPTPLYPTSRGTLRQRGPKKSSTFS